MSTASQTSAESLGQDRSPGRAEFILPCPFCGSTKISVKERAREYYVVKCATCGGFGPGDMAENFAVQRWNSRAALAASFRSPVR